MSNYKIACYVQGKEEFFDILTETTESGQDKRVLYHDRRPLGSALADLLYEDLENFTQIEVAIKEKCQEQLEELALAWMDKGALFYPVAVEIMNQLGQLREGKISLHRIKSLMMYYKTFQPVGQRIVTVLAGVEQPDRTKEAYFHQLEVHPEYGFPTLECGGVLFRPISMDTTVYYVDVAVTDDPAVLSHFLIAQYLKGGVRYRRCKFCDRYFAVTGNPKAQFCYRRIEGSRKTCKEMGASRSYIKRVAEQDVVREFRRSYKAHNARVRRGTITREEFLAWSQEARRQRDLCLGGQLPYDRFVTWLDSDRIKCSEEQAVVVMT